jgi:hypothetical protein
MPTPACPTPSSSGPSFEFVGPDTRSVGLAELRPRPPRPRLRRRGGRSARRGAPPPLPAPPHCRLHRRCHATRRNGCCCHPRRSFAARPLPAWQPARRCHPDLREELAACCHPQRDRPCSLRSAPVSSRRRRVLGFRLPCGKRFLRVRELVHELLLRCAAARCAATAKSVVLLASRSATPPEEPACWYTDTARRELGGILGFRQAAATCSFG